MDLHCSMSRAPEFLEPLTPLGTQLSSVGQAASDAPFPFYLFTRLPCCLARHASWPSCMQGCAQHCSSHSAPHKAEIAPEPARNLLSVTIPMGHPFTCLHSPCSAQQQRAVSPSFPSLHLLHLRFCRGFAPSLLLAAWCIHKAEVRATCGAAGTHTPELLPHEERGQLSQRLGKAPENNGELTWGPHMLK